MPAQPPIVITITNLRSIRHLEFTLPGPGTYVVTGENGIGKSTFFACLEGIVNNQAFSKHFTDNVPEPVKENIRKAVILYRQGDIDFRLQFKKARWGTAGNPQHFRSSEIYSGLHLIYATEYRLFRQRSPANLGLSEAAPPALKDAMVRLTGKAKFNSLKMHRAGDQRGAHWYLQREKVAFAVDVHNGEETESYTDISFSLGETMLLNLLYYFEGIPDRALVLIDEIELALHPKVQAELLRFLEEKATEKKLTVFISTHSASLIKAARNLIYLYSPNGDGNVQVVYKCYPSLALRDIAILEDFLPDFVFFVEDEMAKMLLEKILKWYWMVKGTQPAAQPQVRIVSVGGWPQVLLMLDAVNGYIFPPNVRRAAFLDQDVNETVAEKRAEDPKSDLTTTLLAILDDRNQRTEILPITPELGLLNAIEEDPEGMKRLLQSRISEFMLDFRSVWTDYARNYRTEPDKPRKRAKKRIEFLCKKIMEACNRQENTVMEALFDSWLEWYIRSTPNANVLKGMMGRALRR